ncbi:MAG: hypothetical protein ACMUIP_07800 [bacterium]
MDKLDELIIKFFNKRAQKLTSLKGECPPLDLLEAYRHNNLKAEKKAVLDSHLQSCSECSETLKYIKMLEHGEASFPELPPHMYDLHKKIADKMARNIAKGKYECEKEEKNHSKPEGKVRGIIISMNNLLTRILNVEGARMRPLEGVSRGKNSKGVLQRPDKKGREKEFAFTSRLKHDVKKSDIKRPDFPIIEVQSKERLIHLKISPSGKNRYLALTVHYFGKEDAVNLLVEIYPAGQHASALENMPRSSVYLHDGEASFPGLKEGAYRLEFHEEGRSLEPLEFSICIAEK